MSTHTAEVLSRDSPAVSDIVISCINVMERAVKAILTSDQVLLVGPLSFYCTSQIKSKLIALRTKPEDLSCLKNLVEKHAGDEKFEAVEKEMYMIYTTATIRFSCVTKKL